MQYPLLLKVLRRPVKVSGAKLSGAKVIGGNATQTTKRASIVVLCCTALFSLGCTPTVRVEPSDKPITINLNVKIEHEIRVKVEKELDDILSEDSGLF